MSSKCLPMSDTSDTPSLSLPGSGSRCQNSGSQCRSQLRPGLAVRPRSRSQLARVFRYVNTREVRPWTILSPVTRSQQHDYNRNQTLDRALTNNYAKNLKRKCFMLEHVLPLSIIFSLPFKFYLEFIRVL